MSLTSVCEDIRALLAAEVSFGLTDGTDLFSFEWGSTAKGEEINKQVLIIDTDSIEALIKDEYENPTFSIQVRGSETESMKIVHDRARDIYEFMLQQVRQTNNGNEYVQYAPIGGLIPLGRDDENRVVYSMNFFTFREAIGV